MIGALDSFFFFQSDKQIIYDETISYKLWTSFKLFCFQSLTCQSMENYTRRPWILTLSMLTAVHNDYWKCETSSNPRAKLNGAKFLTQQVFWMKYRQLTDALARRPVSCKPLDSFFTPSDWTRHDCTACGVDQKMVNSCRRARYSG